MRTLAEENYLKAIYNLSQQESGATASKLSEQLNVKLPTINSMVNKLAEKELVEYQKYKGFILTAKGQKYALEVIRKHRLTELFLVKIMGFGWEEVHDIAEEVEHIKSPAFFEKMDLILSNPKFDPHGTPIPDKEGKLPKNTLKQLSSIEVGKTTTFVAVSDSSTDFLSYLSRVGLTLYSSIQIIDREVFDGLLKIKTNKQTITLSGQVADKILVE
ncbi:MAG: metal-dependent transcriptional regulator [Bacteroidia bacterium]|nr:metal-dependent transcriptional regulator [Bacteroidia bacterium]